MKRYLNRLGICALVGGLSLSVAFAAGGKMTQITKKILQRQQSLRAVSLTR